MPRSPRVALSRCKSIAPATTVHFSEQIKQTEGNHTHAINRVVKRVLAGFGFIGRAKDRDIFFHFTSCLGEKLPAVGDRVEFDIAADALKLDARPHAINVRAGGA